MQTSVRIDPEAIDRDRSVSVLLGVSPAALPRARDAGELRYRRAGRRVLYLGRWLLDWLDSRVSPAEAVPSGPTTRRPSSSPKSTLTPKEMNSEGQTVGTTYPAVDESLDRLHRAGWSVGDYGTAARWVVSGANGENLIFAVGSTRPEAWWRACQQAETVGMSGPARLRRRR